MHDYILNNLVQLVRSLLNFSRLSIVPNSSTSAATVLGAPSLYLFQVTYSVPSIFVIHIFLNSYDLLYMFWYMWEYKNFFYIEFYDCIEMINEIEHGAIVFQIVMSWCLRMSCSGESLAQICCQGRENLITHCECLIFCSIRRSCLYLKRLINCLKMPQL